MAVEIEAKMKVPNHAATRQRLVELGAKSVSSQLETNMFFDTEDRSLLTADKGLRLRVNRDATTATEKYVITYKGPRKPGALKSREELELVVDNAAAAEQLLTALGYRRVLQFEKRRESWDLENCHVELDELPHLGVYVEIEGPSEPAVMRVREALGLSKQALLKTSYVAMLLSHLQNTGESGRVVKFGDADLTAVQRG